MKIGFVTDKNLHYLSILVEQSIMFKTISGYFLRETVSYVPRNKPCLNRLFSGAARKSDKSCLTIDCRGINLNSPGKFETKAEDTKEKFCYFNLRKL